MATTYTIKSGDNLTKIASQYGTTVDALAKANGIANPNLIIAGKTLTIPTAAPAAPAPTSPTTMAGYLGSSSGGSTTPQAPTTTKTPDAATLAKINEIKTQLGLAQTQLKTAQDAGYTGTNASKEIKYDTAGKIVNAADAYSDYSSYDAAQGQYTSGLDKINTSISAAKTNQSAAYSQLKTLQTDSYNKYYSELGLDSKKSKIEALDADITAKTSARDKAVTDENGKPIAQWLITGDLKLAYDRYNDEINTLKNERNALATEYNTGLDEVGSKVDAAMADAKTAAAYWDSQVSNLENKATNYQTQLMAILKDTKPGENKTSVVTAGGRVYKIVTDAQGNTVSKEDLGADTVKNTTANTPASYDEWQLAGGQQGTGQSYAQWLTTSKGTKPEKETDISSLENTKSTISGLLANQNLKKVVNKGAFSNLPYAWENLSSEEKNIIAIIDQLISQSTLDALISAKAKGATFGALSDKESAMLRSAGSKIGSWTMENKNGKTVGYSIDEKSFRTELQTLLDLTNKAINVAGGGVSSGAGGTSSAGQQSSASNSLIGSFRTQYGY